MHKRSKQGFTLAEVMIASAVLVIVVVSFVGAYIAGMRAHLMASDYYRATCLVRNRLQRAKALEFGSLPLLAEAAVAVDEDGNPDLHGPFQRTTIVRNVTADSIKFIVQVRFPTMSGGLSATPVEMNTRFTRGM